MAFQYLTASKILKFVTNEKFRKFNTSINSLISKNTFLTQVCQMSEKTFSKIKTYPIENLHHLKIGTGSHIVALLPGLFGSIETDFQLLLPKLNKDKFTWITWDPPGYGKSQPPSRDFSGDFIRRDAHTFVKLMQNLGYEQFSVVGWSMGGMTGAVIGIDFPEVLQKLIIWGSHSRADLQSVKFGDSIRSLNGWPEQIRKALVAAHGGSEAYLEQMSKDWADANQRSLEMFGFEPTPYEHLYNGIPNITAKTLIIYGEKDPMIGIEHAKFYHRHIRNSKFYIWPNAKHNLHLKYPDKFLKMVTEFLLEEE